MGRPSLFTEELAKTILDRVASGETVRAICREDDMPDRTTIRNWMERDKAFADAMTQAFELRADHWVDEIIEIGDDQSGDTIEVVTDEGELKIFPNTAKLTRDKMRMDARKWAASKLYRRRYGDHTSLEHTGKDGGPIESNTNFIDRPPPSTRDQWLRNVSEELSRPELVEDVEGE